MSREGEFSVWVFLRGGHHFPVEEGVDAETAVRAAHIATRVPGSAARVIIVDGADNTCFEWKRELGVTFPTREQCA